MSPRPPSLPSPRVCLLALLTTACEPPPPLPELRYETEHLRIGTSFDAPLCRGDLEDYERVLTTVAANLGASVPAPVEVYLWGPHEDTSALGWCEDWATGCVRDGVVFSDLGSIEHELVHVVIAGFADPAPFWNEGAAESLQSERTQLEGGEPLDHIDLAPPQLSYLSAGHFSRWLWETQGPERFRALLRESGDARTAFANTYPFSLEDAQAQYLEQAPYSYRAFISCGDPELSQVDAQSWSESIVVDCGEASVHGGPLGMGARRVLTVTERGNYTLTTTADIASISRCADEDLLADPASEPAAWGDVPPLVPGILHRYIVNLEVEQGPITMDLAPGRYELAVGFANHDPASVQLDVARSP